MSKKTILIIIITGIFIGWAGFYLWKKQQPIIEPKQTEQTECEKIIYFNETYGYTLKIPKEWAGKYEIRKKGNTTSFFYNVIPLPSFLEGESLLFSVTVYSKNEWEEELKEREESEKKGLPPGSGKVFDRDEEKGRVFEYDISISNPYDDPEISPEIADEFSKMAGQVPEIIASFSLSK